VTAYAKSFAAAALVALLASAPASARPATGTGATQAPPVGGEAVPAPSPSATPVPSSKPVPYGVSTAPGPAITRLDCAASCAGAAVRPGSLLRVRGKAMQRGEEVVFLGAAGEGDDVAAATTVRRRTSVDVRVPLGAPAGPVAVVDRDRRTSAASVAPLTMATSQAITLAGAAPAVELAVRAPRAYYGAVQPAALTYVVHAPAPIDATVELTRVSDGVAIARWPAPQVAPDTPQTVTWDGTAGGAVQRDGEYAFRVSLAGVDGPPQPASFTFSRDRFPLLGPHVFGTGGAAFGGGRGHQGQDVFAACGTPLVAAHAGTVKYAGFQSRAGFYLVTDNDGATTDYSYMHLREEALVKAGDHVVTGQLIGYVGDTGDADGCHLHFEIWTAPGWYAGGQPIDPLPSLRAWDRRS
jgi:murein DD-endopeptidase MepM/ murein hydrolase activator NlpD